MYESILADAIYSWTKAQQARSEADRQYYFKKYWETALAISNGMTMQDEAAYEVCMELARYIEEYVALDEKMPSVLYTMCNLLNCIEGAESFQELALQQLVEDFAVQYRSTVGDQRLEVFLKELQDAVMIKKCQWLTIQYPVSE